MKNILYMCSYVPYTLLEQAGFNMVNIADIQQPIKGNMKLSGNLCSLVNYCTGINYKDYDGIIFTNCCNSMQRLYDYVRYSYQDIFTHMMEVPNNDGSVIIEDLLQKLSLHFGIEIPYEIDIKDKQEPEKDNCLWIISSAMHRNYKEELTDLLADYNLRFHTCTSEDRGDQMLMGNIDNVSCPRMMNFYDWFSERIDSAVGLIYIMTKRCDHNMFLYPELYRICKKTGCHLLCVEEEYPLGISEGSKIRYEAFIEYLKIKNGEKL